jgi:hypothetical protein
MRRVIVRYKLKADRLEEHEKLVRAVFAELASKAPAGIRYGAFKNGLEFTHIAFIEAPKNPLDDVAAFKAFGERIKERCEEAPVVTTVETVGAFGF